MTSPLTLGPLALKSRVLVAPMAGITDAPFREIAANMGAGLVTTEMVAAEAVVRSTQAMLALLDFPPLDTPVCAQFVGCDAGAMAEAATIAVERGANAIDVNLGCPVKKVVGIGSGAALARNIHQTADVLAAMVNSVSVPVTAKMRLGWDHTSINAPELAAALESVGVAAVSVHGRTRAQAYTGWSNWDEIARVKEAVNIPVFGSGDVASPAFAQHQIESGRVDGVIIARGMLGDFHMVQRTCDLVDRGESTALLPFSERMDLTRHHLHALSAYYGENKAVRIGRKYVSWTIKGCAGAARLRQMVQGLETLGDVDAILDQATLAGERSEGPFLPIFISGEG